MGNHWVEVDGVRIRFDDPEDARIFGDRWDADPDEIGWTANTGMEDR